MSDCRSHDSQVADQEFELLQVRQTNNVCGNCEAYVSQNVEKPWVIVSCEGACLRGEISRRVADRICHTLLPDETVRVCQGSALSKRGGQRQLVLDAQHIVFLEGCPVQCASRLFHSFASKGDSLVVFTDGLAAFDKSLFGSNELPSAEIDAIAASVADAVITDYLKASTASCAGEPCA